jgi:hypothetical protein
MLSAQCLAQIALKLSNEARSTTRATYMRNDKHLDNISRHGVLHNSCVGKIDKDDCLQAYRIRC